MGHNTRVCVAAVFSVGSNCREYLVIFQIPMITLHADGRYHVRNNYKKTYVARMSYVFLPKHSNIKYVERLKFLLPAPRRNARRLLHSTCTLVGPWFHHGLVALSCRATLLVFQRKSMIIVSTTVAVIACACKRRCHLSWLARGPSDRCFRPSHFSGGCLGYLKQRVIVFTSH